MTDPNIKVKVVHSQSKTAWNLVGKDLGHKYKIARFPYTVTENEEANTRARKEAHTHAEFAAWCFNNSKAINDKKWN